MDSNDIITNIQNNFEELFKEKLSKVAFTGEYSDIKNRPYSRLHISLELQNFYNPLLTKKENDDFQNIDLKDTAILNYDKFIDKITQRSFSDFFENKIDSFLKQRGAIFCIITKNNILMLSNLKIKKDENDNIIYYSLNLFPIHETNYDNIRFQNISEINQDSINQQLIQLQTKIKNITLIIDPKYKILYAKSI